MSNDNCVLVCVTLQKNSFRLIKKGARVAQDVHADLHILHVKKSLPVGKQNDGSKILDDFFAMSKQVGATIHVEISNNIPKTITDFIQKNHVNHVVLGESVDNKIAKLLKKDIVKTITNMSENVNVLVLKRKNV